MSKCCFFGHSRINTNIEKELKETIIGLIITKDVKEFYVGNNGAFDSYVIKVLNEISKVFPYVSYNRSCLFKQRL